MDDTTLSSALITGSIALTLLPGLVFFWFIRRPLIRVLFWLCRNTHPWIRLLRIGICLFTGLMLSVIVGVFYQEAWMPGAYFLCDGQVEIISQTFSYKPGQHGSNLALLCTDASGKQTRITLASIFLSALLYSVALIILVELFGLMARTFWPATPEDKAQTVQSTATSYTDFSGSSEFFQNVLQRAQAAKQKTSSTGVTIMVNGKAITSSNSGDLMERLQKLQQLLDAGLIDQSEYDAKRKELLNTL